MRNLSHDEMKISSSGMDTLQDVLSGLAMTAFLFAAILWLGVLA